MLDSVVFMNKSVAETCRWSQLFSQVMGEDSDFGCPNEALIIIIRRSMSGGDEQVGVDIDGRLDQLLQKPFRRFALV